MAALRVHEIPFELVPRGAAAAGPHAGWLPIAGSGRHAGTDRSRRLARRASDRQLHHAAPSRRCTQVTQDQSKIGLGQAGRGVNYFAYTQRLSGWFTLHGELYHEERRTLDEIAAADWTTLLDHADSIGFFTRPEPQRSAPDARIFHVTITSCGRSRELAVNDPSEASELAMLVRLTRWAMRDRLVLRPTC